MLFDIKKIRNNYSTIKLPSIAIRLERVQFRVENFSDFVYTRVVH